MSKHSEPPEKWQRVLAAAKASQAKKTAPASQPATACPPEDFSTTLLGRVHAFHTSLAVWQRWSLLAGLISILVFIASLVYLKSTATEDQNPLIDTPRLELPQPSTPTDR